MVTVTSRRAKPDKKILARRLELCKELLAIEKKLAPDNARYKVIETELKKLANDADDSFRHDVAGLGNVTVAPGHEGEFKGDVPQVVTEHWNALKATERKALLKNGLIAIVGQYGSKSYGRVTVKLF